MPLPAAIEFLAAQKDTSGNHLCAFGMSYVEVVIPPATSVRWEIRPEQYMSYDFRAIIDASIVPNAFSISIIQYGVRPYTATIFPSAQNIHIDYFLRVTQAMPIINEVTNLTPLNQRWVSADQYLKVPSEDVWLELERRLADYFIPTLQAAAVLDLTRVERLMTELVQLTRERPVAPQPERVSVAAPPPDRRRVLGPLAERER